MSKDSSENNVLAHQRVIGLNVLDKCGRNVLVVLVDLTAEYNGALGPLEQACDAIGRLRSDEAAVGSISGGAFVRVRIEFLVTGGGYQEGGVREWQ